MASLAYGVEILPDGPLGQRRPRAEQSLAAAGLLARLGDGSFDPDGPAATSKSHSRSLVAAARITGPQAKVGIDIEYRAEGRNLAPIAAMLLESSQPGLANEDFYRMWTVYEAYFKAVGQHPPAGLLRRVAQSPPPPGRACQLAPGVGFLHETVAEAFALSVIWAFSGAVLTLDLHRHPMSEASIRSKPSPPS